MARRKQIFPLSLTQSRIVHSAMSLLCLLCLVVAAIAEFLSSKLVLCCIVIFPFGLAVGGVL